jgi:arsenate reductase
MTQHVLILCTGNSCRSQMAQVIWQQLGQGDWNAESAGSRPAGYVHPLALKALEEIGLDISGLHSKSVDQFSGQEFDLAVTVCDHAKEACPVLPGVETTLHWPFEDPANATGSDEEKMDCFRRVRDQIRQRIKEYLEKITFIKNHSRRSD